jgi:hypothetical protein
MKRRTALNSAAFSQSRYSTVRHAGNSAGCCHFLCLQRLDHPKGQSTEAAHSDLGFDEVRFYTSGPFFPIRFPQREAMSAWAIGCNRVRRRALFAALSMVALMLPSTGCVRRRLTVRTNPPGAQVFVDDQEIGTTPCSAAFVYYGTRKITLMKDGYRTETIFQKIRPPWYELPPLDFFVENFYPLEQRDERVVDVQLVPAELVPQQKLIGRAQMLRDNAQAGAVTPLTALSAEPPTPPTEQIGYPGVGLPGGQPLPYEPAPTAPPFRP